MSSLFSFTSILTTKPLRISLKLASTTTGFRFGSNASPPSTTRQNQSHLDFTPTHPLPTTISDKAYPDTLTTLNTVVAYLICTCCFASTDFRADGIGLDGLAASFPDDDSHSVFFPPSFLQTFASNVIFVPTSTSSLPLPPTQTPRHLLFQPEPPFLALPPLSLLELPLSSVLLSLAHVHFCSQRFIFDIFIGVAVFSLDLFKIAFVSGAILSRARYKIAAVSVSQTIPFFCATTHQHHSSFSLPQRYHHQFLSARTTADTDHTTFRLSMTPLKPLATAAVTWLSVQKPKPPSRLLPSSYRYTNRSSRPPLPLRCSR